MPPINWDAFEEAGATTRALIEKLIGDRSLLRRLTLGVPAVPKLMWMSEVQELQDRIVLYDAPDRGFRVRWNFSTEVHLDQPHDHRFSFSTKIVRGRYRHIWHQLERPDEELPDHPQFISSVTNNGATAHPLFVTDESAGSCYSLHHSAVHSQVTTPGTLSLMIRGPAEKRRSIYSDRVTGRVCWQFGDIDETEERQRMRKMSPEAHARLVQRLELWALI